MTEIVTSVCVSTSTIVSLTPVNVTVCGVSQLPFVNVKAAALTVTSPVSAETTPRTTSVAGFSSNTRVNVWVPPASVTVRVVCDFVKPAASSLSVVVTVTVWLATESKLSSELPSVTEIVTVVCVSTSTTVSLIPVKVTVCGVSQLLFVNV